MPNPDHWAEITRPDERLRTALVELYAGYVDTEHMLHAGIRDIEHVPAGSRQAFLAYLEAIQAALMAGRRQRGRRRTRVSGAIAHAINFNTWRSLVREQQLTADEAVMLTTAMVHAAAHPTQAATTQTRCAPARSRP
jgi:hypothetical protein